jgi:hypothetical protein
MLESGSSGSVRGASSNGRPYREPRPFAAVPDQPYERTESDAMRKFQVNPPSVPELEATGMVAPCSVKRHNRLLEGRGGVRR